MTTEQELYLENVPHGSPVLTFGDWSTSQADISVTADSGYILRVNTIGFMIATDAAITSGTITLSGDELSETIESIAEIFAYADPFSLKSLQLDGTNDVIVGEIKFNPPVDILGGSSFTISTNALSLTAGSYGPYFTIKGWTVSQT